MTQLVKALLRHATLNPSRVAIETATIQFTYAQLATAVADQAAWLLEQGVAAGSRVILAQGNDAWHLVNVLAVMSIGAIDISVSPDESHDVIAGIMAQTLPCLVIHEGGAGVCAALTLAEAQVLREGTEARFAARFANVQPDPLAELHRLGVFTIQFTSGSTGRPKGVLLTAEGFSATVLSSPHLAEHEGRRIFLGLPLCNSYGRTQAFEFLYMGGTLILDKGFGLPDELFEKLAKHRIQVLEAPPAVYEVLVRSGRLASRGLPLLERCGMAGGRITPTLLERLWKHCPHLVLTNRFGVTEISGGLCRIHLSPEHIKSTDIPCGKAFPYVQIRVRNESGHPQVTGESGAVEVLSPGRMLGYLGDAPTQGWYATGDTGYINADGELTLLGRTNDMIKRAGVRIFPQELERVLAACSQVDDVAVLPWVDTQGMTERVIAFVVGDVATPELVAWCQGRLPRERLPDRIVNVQQIPLSPTGKIDRQRLLASLAITDR